MSLKQLVLELTSEARKELREILDFVEAKETEIASEMAAEIVDKAKEKADVKAAKSASASAPEAPAPAK